MLKDVNKSAINKYFSSFVLQSTFKYNIMENIEKQLENLNGIKELMEKSTQFLSLSGLSGIFAGVFALLGATAVYLKYNTFFSARYFQNLSFDKNQMLNGESLSGFVTFLLLIAIVVFVLAISTAIYFSYRKAKNTGNILWSNSARRLLINLFLPIFTGGLFIIALILHHHYYLIAPAALIFYGLGLLNASKYTLHDIRYLGLLEIMLGILSSFFIGFGLIFWSLGFGLLHIIYGFVMYVKYEK